MQNNEGRPLSLIVEIERTRANHTERYTLYWKWKGGENL